MPNVDAETLVLLEQWQGCADEVTRMRALRVDDPSAGVAALEMQLRRLLAERLFPNPVEGHNDFDLVAGYVLRCGYALARTIDWPALLAAREELAALGVSLDGLVEMQPRLRVAVYKALPRAARLVVDRALEIKPAAPTLKIVKKGE